ncbi:MAG: transglutaminaseTgpA domain-containing protein [Myxococcota bacterium]
MTWRPTRDGIVALAGVLGLLAVGLVSGNNLVYLVAAPVCAALLLSPPLGWWNLRHVEVRRLLPAELYAGREAGGSLLVRNGRRRMAAHALHVVDEGTGAVASAARVEADAVVGLPVRWRFGERGPTALTAVTVWSRWPFGMTEHVLRVALPAELVVYPRPLPSASQPRARHEYGAEQESVGHGPGELVGMRPYQPGTCRAPSTGPPRPGPTRCTWWSGPARPRSRWRSRWTAPSAARPGSASCRGPRGGPARAAPGATGRAAAPRGRGGGGAAAGAVVGAAGAARGARADAPAVTTRLARHGVVLAGLFALALVGPVDAVAAGLGAAAYLGAPALRRAARLPWPALTALTVVALVATAFARGLAPAEALGVLLVYLQLPDRLTGATRRGVVLAALMLVVAAGVTRDPAFAVAVAAWTVCLPLALMPTPPRWLGGGLLALLASGLAALLFAAAPRAARTDRDATELTGFAAEVELGSLDRLLDDPTPVLRAAVRPPPTEPVYWRGVALDTFDGTRWSSGSSPVRTAIQPPASFPASARVIEVEPADPGVLFTAGWPLDLAAGGAPLWVDGQGAWSTRVPVDRYRLVAQGPLGVGAGVPYTPPESDAAALQRALQLPRSLDPRIAPLARQIAGTGPARERVARLADYLRGGYAYTRRPADAGAEEPLGAFLFERRAGHCEYFAAALAVMARTVGVPARVVNGFVGGEVDPRTGWLSVRRYDAHAWVEVHDGGWIVFDATPGPVAVAEGPPARAPLGVQLQRLWDDGVLGYDRGDQLLALLRAARHAEAVLPRPEPTALPWRGLLLLAGLCLAGSLVGQRVARRVTRRLLDPAPAAPSGPVARAHRRARRVVAGRGWRIPEALPPVAAAEWLRARAPGEAADALGELAWLYTAAALGRGEPADAARARGLLQRVETLAAAR